RREQHLSRPGDDELVVLLDDLLDGERFPQHVLLGLTEPGDDVYGAALRLLHRGELREHAHAGGEQGVGPVGEPAHLLDVEVLEKCAHGGHSCGEVTGYRAAADGASTVDSRIRVVLSPGAGRLGRTHKVTRLLAAAAVGDRALAVLRGLENLSSGAE